MTQDKYQTVIITFSDGRKAYFVGRSVVDGGDEIAGLKIVDTVFTRPKPMPQGCKFELITSELKEDV